jgi:hypothetical protein
MCRLKLHKWRNYGQRVIVAWEEPGLLPGTRVKKSKQVLSQRECLRCGLKEKRKFNENLDGTQAVAGWKREEDSNK